MQLPVPLLFNPRCRCGKAITNKLQNKLTP